MVDRLAYIEHWEQEIKQLKTRLKKVDPTHLINIQEGLNRYADIRSGIDNLMNIIGDMNAFTKDVHLDTDFEAIIRKIEEENNKGQADKTIDRNSPSLSKASYPHQVTCRPLTEFKTMVKERIQAALNQASCISTEIMTKFSAGGDTEKLAEILCNAHPRETLMALLEAMEVCFAKERVKIEKDSSDKTIAIFEALKENVIGMMSWLLLLSVKDDWLLNEQYNGTIGESLCIKIPVRTKSGLEIVVSRINEKPANFKAGPAGHDLCGEGHIAEGAEVGWDTDDVIDELKGLLWNTFYKVEPPKQFTKDENIQLNASLSVKRITEKKHYLPIPVSDEANPFNNESTYVRLLNDLPSLNLVFFGAGQEGVLVLEEAELKTLVSEILSYIRKQ